MSIKIFNTLSKKKEVFKPVNEDKVSMYVCGPTVYSNPHIGNARSALIGDLWFRVLKNRYKNVTYIRNITDVDDKIIDAASHEKKTVTEISEQYSKIYKDNMELLGLLIPTIEPKVTEYISKIIKIIEKIISSGYTYTEDNHVMFDTVKYREYGKLTKRIADDMLDGVRIDVASYKKSPKDFILWKPSKSDQVGWNSPWGFGRPGWHIECTSMIKEIIGHDTTLDIHGGGNDLIFPHHENEIAQGNCVSKNEYCNYWFHNGIVLVDKKKMSKSLGNVISAKKAMNDHGADVIRLWVAATDYRGDLAVSDEILKRTSDAYRRIRNTARFLLANLNGFKVTRDLLSTENLLALDRWVIYEAKVLQEEIIQAYESYQFHHIYHRLHNFCSLELGGFYLDIIKDRQYTTAANSKARRSAQTAMYHIIQALSRWIAPILSHTAEEIWEHIPGEKLSSVFLSEWYAGFNIEDPRNVDFKMNSNFWQEIMEVRTAVYREIENQRNSGNLRSSLDAQVKLFASPRLHRILSELGDELRFVLITSDVTVLPLSEVDEEASKTELEELQLTVDPSLNDKCIRCWHKREDVGNNSEHPELCGRCILNVYGDGEHRLYA